jgi:hypothetical protein
MNTLTLKEIKAIAKKVVESIKDIKVGESVILFSPDELEEINGISENLFATKLPNDAALIHYDTIGDWTKSVVIPADNFDEEDENVYEFSSADEAIEWFFK